jgi:hypothetical protein
VIERKLQPEATVHDAAVGEDGSRRTFLLNQAEGIAEIDMFVVE